MNPARTRKLGERIAQIVAEMLEHRIKDPRLGFVTITEARVTGDLREATVFYTVYGSETEQAGTAAALASATGLIRSTSAPVKLRPVSTANWFAIVKYWSEPTNWTSGVVFLLP